MKKWFKKIVGIIAIEERIDALTKENICLKISINSSSRDMIGVIGNSNHHCRTFILNQKLTNLDKIKIIENFDDIRGYEFSLILLAYPELIDWTTQQIDLYNHAKMRVR